MRTLEDEVGRRYLLVKRSAESSLVRDVETGEVRYVANERLAERAGVDPLEAAAAAVSPEVRRLVTTVHDDRGLGLLVSLAREPRAVRVLLGATDLCESDLLGLTSELRAAELIEEATVDGERGYAATETARDAIATLVARDGSDDATGVDGTDDSDHASGSGGSDDVQSAGASTSETSD